MPFFGDMRSQFILSSLLLHRFLNKKPNQYFILCSFPGLGGLFPYVDEFWSLKDYSELERIYDNTSGFVNNVDSLLRSLNQNFNNVMTFEGDLAKYYSCGISRPYFDEFETILFYLPQLRSLRVDYGKILSQHRGHKVFIHPVRVAKCWDNGMYSSRKINVEFWYSLIKSLVAAGMVPVVWQNYGSYTLDDGERTKNCVLIQENNVSDILAVMRGCSCVVEVFNNGLNRYASVARVPFISVDSRTKYAGLKEYELDDLTILNKEYRYIFSFPTILQSVGRWSSIVDGIVCKLNDLITRLNKDKWPNTSEVVSIRSYDLVRERKSKRIGSKYIKVKRL
jgi:hypothetical protein